MSMKTNTIVAAIIEHDDLILFMRRVKEPFKGTLILPGGKVEGGETADAAVEREIFEETGLRVKRKAVVGQYDETVFHDGEATHRHLLTIYHVLPTSFAFRDSYEGTLHAIKIADIPSLKQEINASDYRMIERAVFQKQQGFNAKIVVEKSGDRYSILSEEDLVHTGSDKLL